MRIINIKGGLGNQMFQYAFLLAHRQYHPMDEYLMDISSYGDKNTHNGFELCRRFHIDAKIAGLEELNPVMRHIKKDFLYRVQLKTTGALPQVFLEKDFSKYYPNVLQTEKYYYDGYWQCHKYFDSIAQEVKKTFSFKDELDERNAVLIEQMQSNPYSVSVHIRRGDYLDSPLYAGLCDMRYYKNAIEWISTRLFGHDIVFYVFSNDIEWCKQNLVHVFGNNQFVYVIHNTGEGSYKDMKLMSSCHYNIIANSSFSWWAAYLNSNPNHVVLSPKRWINTTLDYKIQMDSWELI